MDVTAIKHSVSARPASETDIPFIMSVERIPGYSALVGSFDAVEHRRRFHEPNTTYFICVRGAEPIGFAVVRLDGDGMGNAQLHRIAMAPSGLGYGTAFLNEICRTTFALPGVGRLWLDLLPSNAHAKRVYAKAGFVEEGTMRFALRLSDGSRNDLVLMSLLREDWECFAQSTSP